MSNQQKKKTPWMGLSPSKPLTEKKRPPWLWLILGAFTGIIIVVIAFNIALHLWSNNTHNTAQAAHSSAQTPGLATPQAIQQYTLQLAQNSGASGVVSSSHYDSSVRGVIITETVGDEADHNAFRATIESDCFLIQQAIWESKVNLAAVEVNVLGPIVDPKGDKSTGPIGLCGLKEQTAQKFAWNTLTFDQAWNDYDAIWLLPALNNPGDLPFSQQEA